MRSAAVLANHRWGKAREIHTFDLSTSCYGGTWCYGDTRRHRSTLREHYGDPPHPRYEHF